MGVFKLREDAIERMALEKLEALGYAWLYGPDIAPDSLTPERGSFEEVLLLRRLEEAVVRLNPGIPADAQAEALREIQRLNAPQLIANNEAFHRLLTEGIPVTYQKGGETRGDLLWLVDFAHPENNEYLAVNQFTVIENGVNKRPDVVLFVNGLPLVVIELKNAADENATVLSAYKQLQTYKDVIPTLFTYNGLLVISDGLEARAGSLSAGLSRFMAWKTADGHDRRLGTGAATGNADPRHAQPHNLARPDPPFHRLREKQKGRPGYRHHQHRNHQKDGGLPPVLCRQQGGRIHLAGGRSGRRRLAVRENPACMACLP